MALAAVMAAGTGAAAAGAKAPPKNAPSAGGSITATGTYAEGQTIATYDGVPVKYGNQCVDLVQRYFSTKWKGIGSWTFSTGSAAEMLKGHPTGTTAYDNGTAIAPPKVGDALIFGTPADVGGTTPPHVALVTHVDDKSVTFVQQNVEWSAGHVVYVTDSVPIAHTTTNNVVTYQIGTPGDAMVAGVNGSVQYLKAAGWVHADANRGSGPTNVVMAPTTTFKTVP
jgi:hypothetical protein